MPTGPKETESKMKTMLNAWEEIAPEKSFAGTTLDQFRTVVTRALTARARIADLEDQMLQAINERENADEAFNTKSATSRQRSTRRSYRRQRQRDI